MHGTSEANAVEALWKFCIDAGGFPRTIQCNSDPQFIGGKVISLFRSHGCYVSAATPHQQDHNGLVKKWWEVLTNMARDFLADAWLPKWFWYWVIREAARRVNVLPVSFNPDDPINPDFMTTPHFEFYSTKPNYRTLFPFGAIGIFRWVRDGNCDRT